MDRPERTFVKAIIWNVIGLAVMTAVGFFMTGSFAFGGAMAAVNVAVGLSAYVIDERIWSRISWDRAHE